MKKYETVIQTAFRLVEHHQQQKAQESEHVRCYDVELVLTGLVQTIPNLRWPIAMARSFREGEHAIGFCIREIYEKGTAVVQ
jgi:hypothetical protein